MLIVLACAFFVLIAWSVATDLKEMIIPNWVNAAVALLFFPAAFAAGLSWENIGMHLVVGLAGFVVCVALFYLNVFGGGDAKLIPGVLLWLGPSAVSPFVFGMAIAGGLLGLVLIAARNTLPAGDLVIMQKSSGVPYAVAIAVGVLLATPHATLLFPAFRLIAEPFGLSS